MSFISSMFRPTPVSTADLRSANIRIQQSLGTKADRIQFNFHPKNEAEYKASLKRINDAYQRIAKSTSNDDLIAIEKQDLRKKCAKDFSAVCMPTDMCLKEINSGFFLTNLVNFNNGWLIKNPSALITHLKGIYHILGRTSALGNNILSKLFALSATIIVGMIESAFILLFSVLKLGRKLLTAIPATLFYGLTLLFASLSWVFNNSDGGQLIQWVQPMLEWALSKFRELEVAAPAPNFVRRHPYITAAIGGTAVVASIGFAGWYFAPQIATGARAVAGYVAQSAIGAYVSNATGFGKKVATVAQTETRQASRS